MIFMVSGTTEFYRYPLKFANLLGNNPLIDLLGSQSEFKLDGSEYARKKQAPTPKTQEWYNKKSFSLIHFGEINNELFKREFADRLVSGYKYLMPFYDYFITAGE